ncbi:hypothetical protein ES703_47374 [subsurface metagenome]
MISISSASPTPPNSPLIGPTIKRIIAGGSSYNDGDEEYDNTAVWQFKADGSIFKKLLDYPALNMPDVSEDSAVSPVDSSIYCGYWNSTDLKGEVHKFDENGNPVLTWGDNGVIQYPYGSAAVKSVSVDSSGNLYVGIYHHPSEPPHKIFYKYNSNGNLIWSNLLSSQSRWISHIMFASDGVGYLVEYDANTAPWWHARKFNKDTGALGIMYSAALAIRPYGMDVDDFGYVYVTNGWSLERSANDGILQNMVMIDENPPIEGHAESLIVKSGLSEEATIVYAGGYKRNGGTGENENNIWKYDYDFGNLLATKLFSTSYSANANRVSQDDDDKIFVLYGTPATKNIFQLDCSDLSITKTITLPEYLGFDYVVRQNVST